MSAPATRQRFLVGARMIEVWAELEEPVGSEALADKLAAIRTRIDGSFDRAGGTVAGSAHAASLDFGDPIHVTSQEV